MTFRRLSEREQLLVAISAGLIFVFAGALLGELTASDGLKWMRLSSTLVLTVGGGLVASGMVGFILMIYRSTGDRRKRALLLTLFGTSNPGKDIAIVLPRFPNLTPRLQAETEETPKSSKHDSGAIKDGRLTNKYSLAFDDIAASRHIGTIFAELGMAPPRIEFDDDACKTLFGPTPDDDRLAHYKFFFVVGLYSNEVTMEFAKRTVPTCRRRFRLSSKEQAYSGLRGVSYNHEEIVTDEWLSQSANRWDLQIDADLSDLPEENERKPDFALITTCVAPDGRVCMIIGGGRSRATRKAASYLRKSWQSLAEFLENRAPTANPAPNFVAIFDLDGEQDSNVRSRGSFPAGLC